MIKTYSGDRDYSLSDSGNVFWNIFTNATTLLYIYPGFFKWWENKILTGIQNGDRLIYTIHDNNKMCGYMILKLGQNPKICTLQILRDCRCMGYGRKLLSLALNILKKPIITVSDIQLPLYCNMLSEYNFKKIREMPDAYTEGMTEHVFQYM